MTANTDTETRTAIIITEASRETVKKTRKRRTASYNKNTPSTASNDDEEVSALSGCFGLRSQVFVDEQDVSEDEEWDGLDHESVHFLLRRNGEDVATARLREIDREGVEDCGSEDGRLERMAVAREYRGEGWGGRIVRAVESYALQMGYRSIVLNSQDRVKGFYSELGYSRTERESFVEAGIRHVEMAKTLDSG